MKLNQTFGSMPFKRKALIVLLILVLPLLIFIGCFVAYTIQRQNVQLSESARNMLSYYQNAFEADSRSISSYLVNLSSTDYDFQQLCYCRPYLDAHLSSYELMQKFKLQLEGNLSLGALFILAPENDLFRGVYHLEDYPLEIKEEIWSFLKECVLQDDSCSARGWLLREMGGKYFLFHFFGKKGSHTYCAAMMDLNRAIVRRINNTPTMSEALAFFLASDTEGSAFPLSSPRSLEEADIALQPRKTGYYITGGTQKYLIVQAPIENMEISIGYATPYFGFFSGLDSVQVTLLLLSCGLIGLIPICYLLMQKSLFSPMREMTHTIEKLGDGDLHVKMEAPFAIQEFESVRTSFNNMVERIRQLKIASYEKELEAKHAKLQYLQLQIRPHFYQNCLKSLYALAEARQYDSIQSSILALSGYLRFIFRDSMKQIPLSQELRSIRDYMQLQALCHTCPPQCRMEIDAGLEDFLIPPLSLVTFVENSVQHGVTLGHPLIINICVTWIKSRTGDYVSLLVSNNGPPFPDSVLKEAADPEPQIYRSRHVGIINIRYRLQLLYGGAAALSLYNSGGLPCAEIFLPWKDSNMKEEDIT